MTFLDDKAQKVLEILDRNDYIVSMDRALLAVKTIQMLSFLGRGEYWTIDTILKKQDDLEEYIDELDDDVRSPLHRWLYSVPRIGSFGKLTIDTVGVLLDLDDYGIISIRRNEEGAMEFALNKNQEGI